MSCLPVRHSTHSRFNATKAAWPRTSEQERIAEVLMTFEAEQLAVEKELAQLNQLKSGLMNDLLTGRVRVPEGIMGAG